MIPTDDIRPDPDALLHSIKKEEEKAAKAKLKVFFGMCAGVGKTYDMLKSAHEAMSKGIDVVIGYVETHKRPETQALLEGLIIIPRKKLEYKGTALEEMDLDAILIRKPKLVLVDELAHTNAPGSRHTKRTARQRYRCLYDRQRSAFGEPCRYRGSNYGIDHPRDCPRFHF